MNDSVITEVGQLDVPWFNRVLARSGALATGRVTDFVAEPQENDCSRSAEIACSCERRPRITPFARGSDRSALLLEI